MKSNSAKGLSFCIAMILAVASLAQGVITGTVKDEKGAAIPGASISIRETGEGAFAGETGTFTLVIKARKTVTLDVSAIGFVGQSKEVSIDGDNATADFILKEGANNMGDVVVTASNSRRIQLVTPMSVTNITPAKMAKVKFNSQADILRSIPGITAEGGGGEVASNIFIRGLPSGGQYQFTPLQIDGMPVISTMGLNSSAPDVYFRNDLGINNIEFVRGGPSTLFGMGSVAGIINYNSRIGSSKQRNTFEAEVATPGKVKFDFVSSGPLSKNDDLFYSVAGTYRYDEGPIVSGLKSNGYQVRANIRKMFDRGSLTLYGQIINDKVQFFLPYHLTSDRKRPNGWDGETIMTMQTDDIANLSVKTPNGFYQSKGADGVSTKGGYLMAAFQKEFGEGWRFDAKLRSAKYEHQFNFFGVDGSGRNPIGQKVFVDSVAARPPQAPSSYTYTYANDGTPLNSNSLILENNITDRNRPISEMAANMNISKSISGDKVSHTINFGTFLARTEATDYNVQIRYLSEFNNRPKVLNLRYVDGGATKNYTVNGVRSVPGYTNKLLSSNKVAAYLTDEMVFGKLRVDVGFRVESLKGNVIQEKTATATNADGLSVNWGTGAFDKFNVSATDWATAIGVSYQLMRTMNVYGNFSRGYFFPELRGARVTYVGGVPAYPVYETEKINQAELGLKYADRKLIATLAAFTNKLDDRLNVVFLNVGGAVVETANILSSKTFGFEGTFDYEIVKNLRIDGSFTYQLHEYTKDESTPANAGNWLERQPRVMVNGGISYNNKKFDAGIHTDYYGKRFGNASNLVELDPYSIERFDIGYTFKISDESSVRISGGIFNLFNSEGITEGNPRAGNTQTNTGNFFVGRPIIPRSFFSRVTINF